MIVQLVRIVLVLICVPPRLDDAEAGTASRRLQLLRRRGSRSRRRDGSDWRAMMLQRRRWSSVRRGRGPGSLGERGDAVLGADSARDHKRSRAYLERSIERAQLDRLSEAEDA